MLERYRFGLFRAKKRDGKVYPKWRIRYFKDGKAIHSEVGYTDKGRTEEKAKEQLRRIEHEAHLKAVGAPVAKKKDLAELVNLWLSELAKNGGKQQMPASPQHVRQARRKIEWWIRTLKLTSPADVNRAEALAKAYAVPVTASTQDTLYIQPLKTFLNWCVRNDFLLRNPLAGYRKQASEPSFKRRALTVEEALRLIAAAPYRRAMIYKAALLTGLRRGELDSLLVSDVDWKAGKVRLEAKYAKNRKAAEFYLPEAYLVELFAFCAGRELSDKLFIKISEWHTAQYLAGDCKKAGIPVETAEGRIDFHSLRVTFLTWINELGEDVKTVQEMGRHADPRMTFGVYTKVREDRIRSVVTRAGELLLETNRDIPRLWADHTGVTQATGFSETLDFIGPDSSRPIARRAADRAKDKPGQSETSPDIKQAKAQARHFFESATKPDMAGQTAPGELSHRSHALISQVTEALSRLPEADLEAILNAITALK